MDLKQLQADANQISNTAPATKRFANDTVAYLVGLEARVAKLEGATPSPPDPTPPPAGFPFSTGDGLFGAFAVPAGTQVDANSAGMIRSLVAAVTGGSNVSVGKYGVACYFADTGTRKITITTAQYQAATLPATIPMPVGAKPAQGTDGHVAVFHQDGCLFEAWKWDGASSVGLLNGGHWDSGLEGYPAGMGTRGSSFYNPAGIIWPDEIKRGHIDHALLAVLPPACVGRAYVAPSTDSDGTLAYTSALIPEGARLYLPATVSLAGLTGLEAVIGKALQRYGMIVGDKGGSAVAFIAVAPESWTSQGQQNPWPAVGVTVDYPQLPNLARLFPQLVVAPMGQVHLPPFTHKMGDQSCFQ